MHSIHVSHCYCGCLVAVIVASVVIQGAPWEVSVG